jgi:hypothetical protein
LNGPGLPLYGKGNNQKHAKRIMSWPEGLYEYAVLQEMLLESPNQDPWEKYVNEIQDYMIKYGAHYETSEMSFFMMDIKEMHEGVRNFIILYEQDLNFKNQIDSKIKQYEKLKIALDNYKIHDGYLIATCGLSASQFESYIMRHASLLGIPLQPKKPETQVKNIVGAQTLRIR